MLKISAPRFLFIVPTLNSYRLLPRLVSSLLDQEWQDWRVLFVDGSSTCDHRKWLQNCCVDDTRFQFIVQDPAYPGIFGAMNQGFLASQPDDWIVFWGSDDFAPNSRTLFDLASFLMSFPFDSSSYSYDWPDLLVCRGRYFSQLSGSLSRSSLFLNSSSLNSRSFRKALMFGSTPPHQASIFGPGSRAKLCYYDTCFRLAADLDHFLRLSSFKNLCVQCCNLEFVYMSDSGISGQQTQSRLQEVSRAYRRAFGWLWFLPFVMRYVRRVLSLFQ